MNLVLAFGVLFVCSATLADAKTFKVGDDKPVAEITIPDDWKAEASEGSVETTSPDSLSYISVDAVDAPDVREVGKETAEFLAAQKIKVKPETKKIAETKVAGFPTVDITWDATDEDGPTKISLQLVKLSAEKVVVLTYWRSEAGEKSNGTIIDGIEKSLKPIK